MVTVLVAQAAGTSYKIALFEVIMIMVVMMVMVLMAKAAGSIQNYRLTFFEASLRAEP